MDDAASATTTDATARVRELEAALVVERTALAAERERTSALAAERDRLREAYHHLQLELELMRRRLFVAKAERVDTAQLELEFADKLAALDALSRRLDPAATVTDAPATAGDDGDTAPPAGDAVIVPDPAPPAPARSASGRGAPPGVGPRAP